MQMENKKGHKGETFLAQFEPRSTRFIKDGIYEYQHFSYAVVIKLESEVKHFTFFLKYQCENKLRWVRPFAES